MTDHSIETLPSNSNKTHTFILLTLYHLVGPIYTQRMEEGKWNDSVKNFAFFQKINYSLLVWTLYLYAHCSACLYFCTGKKLFTFILSSICHALIGDERKFNESYFVWHKPFEISIIWKSTTAKINYIKHSFDELDLSFSKHNFNRDDHWSYHQGQ